MVRPYHKYELNKARIVSLANKLTDTGVQFVQCGRKEETSQILHN